MILRVKNKQGQFIDIPAIKGAKGADGKTPQKGIDYFTQEDIDEIKKDLESDYPDATREDIDKLFENEPTEYLATKEDINALFE